MVRSLFIVVSDDQALVQKAQQFGQTHGVTVQVASPEHFNWSAPAGEVPSLVAGQVSQLSAQFGNTTSSGTSTMSGEGGKVLPFPGMNANANHFGGVTGSSERRGVATINQLEASAIENAIGAFKGNLTEAAKALGIGRATLYRKVKQYNIDPSAARNKKKAA